MNWFTIEPVSADTFAISEYSHWEETHAYLLCGADSALLIDTGLGVSNIRHVTDRLTSLAVAVVTTHAHWDHIGGHALFEQIAVHALEAEWLSGQFPIPLQAVKQNLMRDPAEGIRPVPAADAGSHFSSGTRLPAFLEEKSSVLQAQSRYDAPTFTR